MSFDLMIFEPQLAQTPEAVQAHLEFVECNNENTDGYRSDVLAKFCLNLSFDFPQLSDLPDKDESFEESPWASDFETELGFVHLAMQWRIEQCILDIVYKHASKLGLVVYDPQSDCCTHPDGSVIQSASKPKNLLASVWNMLRPRNKQEKESR